MKTRLANLWEKIHTSYWFVPTVIVGISIVLAFFLIWLDSTIDRSGRPPMVLGFDLLYTGGTEGARELLSTIAASFITIAGVTYSITVVALSLASSQFGPLVLRNYMRSTGSQVVMGIFVGTFIYCLLILRALENSSQDLQFQLSVSFAVLLGLAGIYAFIYFIHHEAEFIHAEAVIHAAYSEMCSSIAHFYPETLSSGAQPQIDAEEEPEIPQETGRSEFILSTPKSGYVQAVDEPTLEALADRHDLLLILYAKAGDFLMPDAPLASCRSRSEPTDELKKKIIGAFLIGTRRTPEQDAEFTINELVQIALRALSPSLNDPFTAMSCIEQLGAGLLILSDRKFPARRRFDAAGKLRIIARVSDFSWFVAVAFSQIARNCLPQEAVRKHLISTLQTLSSRIENPSRKSAVDQMIAFVHSLTPPHKQSESV